MAKHRVATVLLLTAIALAGSQALAADRNLAVVIGSMADKDFDQLGLSLESNRFRLLPAHLENEFYSLHVAEGVDSTSTASLYDAVDDCLAFSGVNAAGELVEATTEYASFYSGNVAVRFSKILTEPQAIAWGSRAGLASPLQDPFDTAVWVYEGRLTLPQLGTLESLAGIDPVSDVTPVIHTLRAQAQKRSWPIARYHHIPELRNLMVVHLDLAAAPWTDEKDIVSAQGGKNRNEWEDSTWRLVFPGEQQLVQAELLLRPKPAVLRSGAALSHTPSATLTGTMTVKFRNSIAGAQGHITAGLHQLTLQHPIPYIEHGYLYRHSGYGYSIYDAVHALIDSGAVLYAVPTLLASQPDTYGDDTSCLEPWNIDFDYLKPINICSAWDIASEFDNDVTVGALDKGIYDTDPASRPCSRLTVDQVMDFDTLTACPAVTDENWCTSCKYVIGNWDDDHGINVGLVIGSDHSDTLLRGIAPDAHLINARRHSDDGNQDESSDSRLSDSIVWLAGGDPGWMRGNGVYPCTPTRDPDCVAAVESMEVPPQECCEESAPPVPLDHDHRADIINLSFVAETFLHWECTPPVAACAGNYDCAIVCVDDVCGPIEDSLDSIRNSNSTSYRAGGTVVTASVGNEAMDCAELDDSTECACAPRGTICYATNDSGDLTINPNSLPDQWTYYYDLAALPSTIAVGSTMTTGEPFTMSTLEWCTIQWHGDFIDVVAPMGEERTNLVTAPDGTSDLSFGSSSAATAVISGVAALMLQVNPDLTAAQVQCILHETAQKISPPEPEDDDDPYPWDAIGCSFNDDGHSRCVGYGMVDAYQAVFAAKECGERIWSPFTTGSAVMAEEEFDEPIIPFMTDREQIKLSPGNAPNLVHVMPRECICSPEGEVIEGIELPPLELTSRNYPQAEETEINTDVIWILECLASGDCTCPAGSDCVNFNLINEHEHIWHDVVFKACIVDQCWDLPARFPEWKPGQEFRVPMVIDEMIPAMWRATGKLPILKAYSRGVEIPPVTMN